MPEANQLVCDTPRAYSVPVATALLVVVIVTPLAWRVAVPPRGHIASLARASEVMSVRPIAARLTGGFDYRPLAHEERRGPRSDARSKTFAVEAAAATVIDASDDTPSSLHAVAVARLLTDSNDAALASFENAVRRATGIRDVVTAIERCNDAALLSDLAAAYLTGAAAKDGIEILAALNAAERSWQLARTPEAAWNRALSCSATGYRPAAIAAWRDYLTLDPSSEWATEARRRMNDAAATGPRPREELQRELLAALSDGNDAALLRVTGEGTGLVRSYAEETLLPRYGSGDQKALEQARRAGGAIARVSGDFIIADSVAAIDARRQTNDSGIRAALVTFGKAREALRAFRYEAALPLFRDAERSFRSFNVPLAGRCAVFIATLHFYAGAPAPSLAVCATAIEQYDRTRYPSIEAQCKWNEGTVEAGRRRFERARSAFEAARTVFGRIRDARSAAAVDVRLEENDRWTGNVAAAWAHMSRALHGGAADRGYIPLSEAAKVAEAARMPFAALTFYRAAIDAAQTAVEQTDGHLSRSQLLLKLGRSVEARRDLDDAQRFMAEIEDRTAAARLAGEFALAHSTIFLSTNPEEAIRNLHGAIGYFNATANRRSIARAHWLLGRAHLVRRDSQAAERSFLAALDDIEAQREHIATDEERVALIETGRAIAESLIALRYDRGDTAGALQIVERAKGRLLLDAAGYDWTLLGIEAISTPEPGEAYVEYFVLPDRVFIWTVTRSGTHTHTVAIARDRLEQIVDDWQEALSSGDETGARSEGTSLSSLVLAPAWPDIATSRRIVIAGDGALRRAAFVAMPSPTTGAFLVEEHEVASVPSLTWLTARRRAPSANFGVARVVAAVPSHSGDDSALGQLIAAEHDARTIAARFPGSRILSGGDATAAQIAASLGDADVFHFAGHALADERRPALSALVLSGGERLRARDIARWRLTRMRLAVLAACSTGAGPAISDGTASLARTFLLVGSRAAIATLWPVHDDGASRLTNLFYSELAAGRSPGAALQAAQRACLRRSNGRSRYDWAAFQLISP
jgi:CHAT domain-containing protein